MRYYLAIDIGASGGRHILGHIENGRLVTEEIFRFENGVEEQNGSLTWNTDALLAGVLAGLKKCRAENKIPVSVAIDTWGVDYVLLDEQKKPLLPVYAYRDPLRAAIVSEVDTLLSREALYRQTGIQHQPFNTLYQLYCDKKSGKLNLAAYFLQMPDYLAYRLTGAMVNEYTNATTTSLVNAYTKTWDRDVIKALGLKESLFGPLTPPARTIGNGCFLPEMAEEVGFSCEVVTCPSHDTASAFAATRGLPCTAILSSGTWSLIGVERDTPLTSEEARLKNFTNEGGIEYRYRFLKNIMGMWLLQSIRRDTDKRYSCDEMMRMAMASSYRKTFDVNHKTLTAPADMIKAITALLGEDELPLADLLAAVYRSLALSYKDALDSIEALTNEPLTALQIVGGGSSDLYLNRLTKELTGRRVFTGPKEATAIGNLACQVMKDQSLSLSDVRRLIEKSFAVSEV